MLVNGGDLKFRIIVIIEKDNGIFLWFLKVFGLIRVNVFWSLGFFFVGGVI